MSEEENTPAEPRPAPETVEKRLSEHAELLHVALEVAGPVISGVSAAVTSHVLNNRPAEEPPPAAPPTIELPPGVDVGGDDA